MNTPLTRLKILEAYGRTVAPERTGKPGHPKAPYKVAPKDLCYATVTKKRQKGRVGEIVVGAAYEKRSRVSRAINTAFSDVLRHVQLQLLLGGADAR